MEKEQQLKLKGWFTMRHRDKAGKLLREFTMPNVITNAGKAAVAATIVADVAGNEFDYIAIGTGTNAAAATDTQLQTEIASGGGQRAGATGTRVTTTVTNDTAQFVVTYNFTSGFAVTESGVLNAASTGDLLCRQVFSAINVANGDSLEVTWKIQVS